MVTILEGFRNGTDYNIFMNEDGLISAGGPGMALTWMDVFNNGKPVTARSGYAVEVNALWYNALRFALHLAELNNDKAFVEEWSWIPEKFKEAFTAMFTHPTKNYLADCVYEGKTDWTVRPNMLLAISLPFSALSEEMHNMILNKIKSDLLTERGLRSLTPTHPNYKGVYAGNSEERKLSYHQGTVFPWLLSHFTSAWLRLHGKSGLPLIEDLYHGFEPTLFEAGLGSISEIYDGDPPHEPKGAISQAWSVAALIQMKKCIEKTING